jgi:hypothetical protein
MSYTRKEEVDSTKRGRGTEETNRDSDSLSYRDDDIPKLEDGTRRGQGSKEILLQLTYKRRPFTHYHDIVKLADEPITFQSISNKAILYQVLLSENITRIQEEAQRRWEKWVAKRGKELLEQSRMANLDFHQIRVMIETLNRYVCDAFGLVGDDRLQTLRFMSRLWARLKKETMGQWIRIVDEEMKIWEKKPNTNPKALRAAAHMALKLMGYLVGV